MSIMGSFFGDKNLDNIEKSLDDIFQNIGQQNTHSHYTNNDLSADSMELFSDTDEINKILENITIPPDRVMRYQTYDEIVRSAPFVKRMLRVYQPYILQKNPATGQCYIIRALSETKEGVPENKDEFTRCSNMHKQFIEHYNFVKMLKEKIVPYTVLYGDAFVEIIDKVQEEKKVDLNKIVTLNETIITELNEKTKQLHNCSNKSSHVDQMIETLAESLVYVDNEIDKKKQNSQNDEKAQKFDDVLIRTHKPHKIVILETEYGTRIGYLEVMRDEMTRTTNIAQNLSNIIGRLTQNTSLNKSLNPTDVVDKLITGILKKILIKSNTDDVDRTLRDLDPKIHQFIKNIVVEKGMHEKANKLHQLKVRFIREDRMQQFSLPLTTEYLPYGTSLLDPVILPCKLYILSQLGNIITKLSRAPAIRKWTIEQGTSQMSGQLIQRLKRELNNSRITVEDLGSWKSIPKILSDYKDLYLLRKQGNQSLDVDVTSLGDPSIKVQDLQDARSEIIALSGIPAPYLGYNEVIELREQLVHSNVTFATEISDVQENINNSIIGLTDKLFYLINDNKNQSPNAHANITLIPPIVLILQLIEMTTSSIGNILATFQNLQIPTDPFFLLQHYVPYINWDQFREAAKKYDLENQTKSNMNSSQEDEMGGGMGRY